MKFAEEFVESAQQVATMMGIIESVSGKPTSFTFQTSVGKVILSASIVREHTPAPQAPEEKTPDVPDKV